MCGGRQRPQDSLQAPRPRPPENAGLFPAGGGRLPSGPPRPAQQRPSHLLSHEPRSSHPDHGGRPAPLLTSTTRAPPPSPAPEPRAARAGLHARVLALEGCPRRGEATTGPPGKRVRKGQERRPTSRSVGGGAGWEGMEGPGTTKLESPGPRYLRKPGAGDRPSGAALLDAPGLRRLLGGSPGAPPRQDPPELPPIRSEAGAGQSAHRDRPRGRGRPEGARAAPHAPDHCCPRTFCRYPRGKAKRHDLAGALRRPNLSQAFL